MAAAILVASDDVRPGQARRPAHALRRLGLGAWLLVLLLASFAAPAQRVEGDRAVAGDMYSAEVEVRSQADEERGMAFARALAQVLGKLSGDAASASRPGVSQELRHAEQYVRSYDYRQDEGVSATGASALPSSFTKRTSKAETSEPAYT